MTLVAICSAKGSPGVTATALALLLTARRPSLYAELDPAGGDLLAGYLGGRVPADRGLARLASADHRHRLLDEFWQNLLDLDPSHPGQRFALPGLTDPAQAGALSWERLTSVLASLGAAEQPVDVIADCGRLAAAGTPWPLLHRADTTILVARPTAVSLRAAGVQISTIRKQLADHGANGDTLTMAIVGKGEYTAATIADRLGVPVLTTIPDDPETATVLTAGGRFHHKAALLRAARTLGDAIDQHIGRAALERS